MANTTKGLSVEELVALERKRLYEEVGLPLEREQYRQPADRAFRKSERYTVTMLFGGLTRCHDRLIQAVAKSLNYNIELLPTPTKADFQTGREYCNHGMCNPAYFNIGALINYLRRVCDERGLTRQDVCDRFAFFMPGSCGPCRFGMYEAEYRLALRHSGFDGFRIQTFSQKDTKNPDQDDAGLEMTPRVYVAAYGAVMIGDLLVEVFNQLRPYAVDPEAAERCFETALDRVCKAIEERKLDERRPGFTAWALARLIPGYGARQLQPIAEQLFGDVLTSVLRECARIIDEGVEVDFTRPRPAVKVVGEFWAQTTEGDGNFKMFSFLESQGAEVLAEPVTTWVMYLIAHYHQRFLDQWGTGESHGANGPLSSLRRWMAFQRKRLLFSVGERLVLREYERLRKALGATAHPQVDQVELQRLADPYFNSRFSGGEGHLEVGKCIYYTKHHLAHMILALKPFGCLPSTQSDGAQSAVLSAYPDINFIPIETSGEGDVNAYSRVQMALGEAKSRCKEEFKRCLEQTGRDIEAIRAYVKAHPTLQKPFQHIPHHDGVVGRAANFILHAGSCMDRENIPRDAQAGLSA